ncbi:MAG: hypothetical protein DVB31_06565 [Verrucomicrobia bacterium]|nr:MAG: hypothetical protein DVB31_06565 [Verrucomicrobiota bacterium]
MNRPFRAWIALLVLCIAQSAVAGTTNLVWHWSNPSPFGNNIADLAYHTNNPLVAVADTGQLATTTDLATWTLPNTGTRRWLRSATWFGTTAGKAGALLVVSASEGGILLSEDAASFKLVELGTTDWLEGLANSGTRLVAAGDNAAIYTSDNGTNWTRRAVPFNDWLRGATYRTGGPFVVVGENGLIATSADGVAWTRRTSRVATHLNRAAPTRINGTDGIVVAGDGGVALYSPDGSNWTVGRTDVTADLYVATQETRTDFPLQFGAVLVAGDEEVRSGTILSGTLRFTDETSPGRSYPAPRSTYYAGVSTGQKLVLAGRAGQVVQGARSTQFSPAIDWTTPSLSPRSLLFAAATNVAFGTNIASRFAENAVVLSTNRTTNTFYVAVGDGPTILQSDSGATWITALVPTNAMGQALLGVASAPGMLVAVGSGGTILKSSVAYAPLVTTNTYTNAVSVVIPVVLTNQANTLGIAWESAASPTAAALHGVAWGNQRFVACGDGGTLLSSPDGKAWTLLASPTTANLLSIDAGPTGWIATGANGTLLFSPDGDAWSAHPYPTADTLSRGRWLDGLFLAVGQNGTLLSSADGQAWTPRVSGVTNWLNDVLRVDGTYYIAGNQGTVLGSQDAAAWTLLDSITYKSLYGLASIDGQLVAVGLDGSILRSQAGPYRAGVAIGQWPRQSNETLFLFTGFLDQQFLLERSTNLVDWTASDILTIRDAAGTLLYLDPTPNDDSRQYFRTWAAP